MSHEENERIRRQLGGMPTGRNTFADKKFRFTKSKPVEVEEEPSTVPSILPAWLDDMEVGKWHSLPNGHSVKRIWVAPRELSAEECSRHANEGTVPDDAMYCWIWDADGGDHG